MKKHAMQYFLCELIIELVIHLKLLIINLMFTFPRTSTGKQVETRNLKSR